MRGNFSANHWPSAQPRKADKAAPQAQRDPVEPELPAAPPILDRPARLAGTVEQLQADLKALAAESPSEYAFASVRLIQKLRRSDKRQRSALM